MLLVYVLYHDLGNGDVMWCCSYKKHQGHFSLTSFIQGLSSETLSGLSGSVRGQVQLVRADAIPLFPASFGKGCESPAYCMTST